MDQQRLSVASEVLGIDLEYRDLSGWYFRLHEPGPTYAWSGPYDGQMEAHVAAVKTLLYFAQVGQQALDGELEPDEPAPRIKVSDAWRRAFE